MTNLLNGNVQLKLTSALPAFQYIFSPPNAIIRISLGVSDLEHLKSEKIILKRQKSHSGNSQANHTNNNNNNKKRSHTQLNSRKQVIAFQDRVMTINIKEAQHPLKREKQVIDKSSIMLKISTKSMHRVLV